MTAMVIGSAAHSGTPRSNCPTSVRAANSTMMPWEKLNTPDALKMSTKPSATIEYMTPAMSPPRTTSKKKTGAVRISEIGVMNQVSKKPM